MKVLTYRTRQIGKVTFADEPITLEMAWWQLRIVPDEGTPPASPEDDWLQTIGVPAARAWCEGYWGRPIARRIFQVIVNGFPESITGFSLPFDDVISVESIGYLDNQGQPQWVDESVYEIDKFGSSSTILAAPGRAWPTDLPATSSVLIVVKTGFDAPGADPAINPLPDNVRSALLLMLGHLYANREATNSTHAVQQIPIGASELLDLDRMRLGMA